ncbi:hypothetical protein KDL01_08475 [Actinospica durhamensis]|uniref:Uncharacterized protein n=1 Tax=Actinospica durhamensis TaxID=1508375 RepID=A0A941EMX2_9ACTN|nr:hypothetical protein [Actinospica durhamensis]MBR7833298.1 hypothetical protein [Actinospica durhamensis]
MGIPVGLGVLLALLDAFKVMNSDYAAAAIIAVLGIICRSQIEWDRRSREQAVEFGRKLDDIRNAIDSVSELQFYQQYEAFYESLTRQVCHAKREVRVSYLRRFPPDVLNSTAVDDYFKACLAWARQPKRMFRRVVTSDSAGEMARWMESERELMRDNDPRYLVRQVEVRGDAMSVAIIDHEYVYFAFGAERSSVTGFSLRNVELAEYMITYHDELWRNGKDITEPGVLRPA